MLSDKVILAVGFLSVSPVAASVSTSSILLSSSSEALDARLNPRDFYWPSASWPANRGSGNIFTYSCPPWASYWGCWSSPSKTTVPIPTTAPLATTTPQPPQPPQPPPTTTIDSATTGPTTPTTVVRTSIASSTEVVTSAATNTATVVCCGDKPTTPLAMSTTNAASASLAASSASSSSSASGSGLSNKNLVVILSSVLSVVGVVVIAALLFICCRYRQRRGGSLFPRGISPIDDEEIETWKGNRPPLTGNDEMELDNDPEKGPIGPIGPLSHHAVGNDVGPSSPPLLSAGDLGAGATVQRRNNYPPAAAAASQPQKQRLRGVSLDSAGVNVAPPRPAAAKKTPSNVIIYQDPPPQALFYAGAPISASSVTTAFPSFPPISAPAATAAGAAALEYWQQQQQQQEAAATGPRHWRRSEEISPRSARSMSLGYGSSPPVTARSVGMAGRFSLDQDRGADRAERERSDFLFSHGLLSPLIPPPTALQHARAPNSRAGLTDETVPGDPSFLPSPKRQPSRLSKLPPSSGGPAAAVASAGSSGAGMFTARRFSTSSGQHQAPQLTGGAYWHGRSRAARSNSTISGRSFGYAASEVSPSSSGQAYPLPHHHHHHHPQRQLSQAYRSQQQQPPRPASRGGPSNSNNNNGEGSSGSQNNNLYHEYLYHQQRNHSTSSASSSSFLPPQVFGSSSSGAAGAEDSDGPLLGGLSPPRQSPPRPQRGPQGVPDRGSIGRAIG